eukprot:TRINITY_DN518_c1_g2_i1.p1 TRINITY_DN518_c1_g2~~TRINITY_DN518_c1_g2_i1.p1  ORF type:complete len:268 (+),score=108.81 TRINITY_DN518_c1_g2_i1:614-1417(+)
MSFSTLPPCSLSPFPLSPSSFSFPSIQCDLSDPNLKDAVFDVKDDSSETDWCTFGYEAKNTIVFEEKGTGGHEELMTKFPEDKVIYALLRLVDGDRESRRIKFVFITWVGEYVGGMAKGRVSIHKDGVAGTMGQFHVEVRADDLDDLAEDKLRKLLKKAGGADYDTGSNAKGYESQAGDIKKRALSSYGEKEKTGNIGPVIYDDKPLADTTPCDLSGRPMVASPSEAKKNINMKGNLNLDKFSNSGGSEDETTTTTTTTEEAEVEAE